MLCHSNPSKPAARPGSQNQQNPVATRTRRLSSQQVSSEHTAGVDGSGRRILRRGPRGPRPQERSPGWEAGFQKQRTEPLRDGSHGVTELFTWGHPPELCRPDPRASSGSARTELEEQDCLQVPGRWALSPQSSRLQSLWVEGASVRTLPGLSIPGARAPPAVTCGPQLHPEPGAHRGQRKAAVGAGQGPPTPERPERPPWGRGGRTEDAKKQQQEKRAPENRPPGPHLHSGLPLPAPAPSALRDPPEATGDSRGPQAQPSLKFPV